MSMTIALPHLNLSAYAWKATKVAFGAAVFIAMSLPVAFPSKAGSTAAPVPATATQWSSAPIKAPASHRDTQASRIKIEATQALAKKPVPKGA